MDKEFTVEWVIPPKYKIEQPVWAVSRVIGGSVIIEDRVLRYSVILYQSEKPKVDPRLKAILVGYVLTAFNLGPEAGPDATWLEKDLYPSRATASEASTFLKVVLPEEAWLKAIGSEDRKNEKIAGQIELPPGCCGQTGLIRDMLFECKRNGGMIRADALALQQAMRFHEPPNKQEYLGQIFKKLKITWKEGEW